MNEDTTILLKTNIAMENPNFFWHLQGNGEPARGTRAVSCRVPRVALLKAPSGTREHTGHVVSERVWNIKEEERQQNLSGSG